MKTKATGLVSSLVMLYLAATIIKVLWHHDEGRMKVKEKIFVKGMGKDEPTIVEGERKGVERPESNISPAQLRQDYISTPRNDKKENAQNNATSVFTDAKTTAELSSLDERDAPQSEIPDIPQDLLPVLERLLRRSFAPNDRCQKGYFRLQGMEKCRPWLTCAEINDRKVLSKGNKIGRGTAKKVRSGVLNGEHYVAVSENHNNPVSKERIQAGAKNLIMLQPSPYVLQVVGFCDDSPHMTILTESCESCGDMNYFRKTDEFNKMDVIKRFEFAIKIVGSFDYLHHGLGLPRVHCDLHTHYEALKQFIVTEDRKVFMADVDELPQVDKKNGVYATCMEELDGRMKAPALIAPEQRYTPAEFMAKRSRKPIDEKADIWKIPTLTGVLLDKAKGNDEILRRLKKIHEQCKSIEPEQRPTARKILIQYLRTLQSMQK